MLGNSGGTRGAVGMVHAQECGRRAGMCRVRLLVIFASMTLRSKRGMSVV